MAREADGEVGGVWPPSNLIWIGRGGPVGGVRAVGLFALVAGAVGSAIFLASHDALVFKIAAIAVLPVAVGGIVVWVLPATRTTWALTEDALHHRPAVGRPRRFPIASIVSATRPAFQQRTVHLTVRVLGVPVPVDADLSGAPLSMTLTFSDGSVLATGAFLDADLVVALIGGHVAGAINLRVIGRPDGTPPTALARRDVFVSDVSRWDGDEYGPVFIGPEWCIRFNEPLGPLPRGVLLTIAARSESAGAVEAALLDALAPLAGLYVAVRRDAASFEWSGDSLRVIRGERVDQIDLPSERAAHARKVLRSESSYRNA